MKEISLRELLDTEFTINDKMEMVGTFTLDRINMISDILTNLQEENEELNNIIDELEKWLNDNENLLIHYDYESKYEYIYVDELLKKLKELKGDKDD